MKKIDTLAAAVEARLGDRVSRIQSSFGELTLEVAADKLLEVCTALRDDASLRFEQLIDLCGIDYLDHGRAEWKTQSATGSGFSRGVERMHGEREAAPARRFAVVIHLLSVTHNWRVRVRAYCSEGEPPMADSVVDIWPAANWFEREAFDLYGILFRGHPDLRRILTDYGFVGHPFRKDFPLSGNVEVRYDPEKGRVVYEPVSIEPRIVVPKVIRHDHRYEQAVKEPARNG
ncbi:MAG: NADH-quinone oxidoreductase subunit C [Gammaproteobacteria bacterium]|jgi:NADH-quinone oxidoreductase subunit C|nr:NADH-quinone oxidoreductase subunit C [Gammaproteobacteria bacterium]